ncbi:hypothetical protein CLV51_1011055 [Chitinophaga niastensis]|uniref:Uncharacterized protein n=1 Tax=Chitinophaga niastensis TaxID=536980 RepID=A0A2P8HU08_CHINA|nr:hypothetical protein [Chitinophaga niastensis]PSL49720.1 hypothetical protein CLV51_1011055 [Chitinophaga niastensis]
MALFTLGKIFTSNRPELLTPVKLPHIYTITLVYTGDAAVTLKYNAEVQRLSGKDNTQHYFQVTRTALRINDQPATDYLATDLAAQCGSVIYPLQLHIGQGGQILSVPNYKEILVRWNERMAGLKQYFVGQEAEEYIAHTDNTIQNPELFIQSLKQDLFLSAWFSLLYTGYRKQFTVDYPLQAFQAPISFSVVQERPPMGGPQDNIHQKGTLISEALTGSMEIKCLLNKPRDFIQQVEGYWELQENEKTRTIAIRAICVEGES